MYCTILFIWERLLTADEEQKRNRVQEMRWTWFSSRSSRFPLALTSLLFTSCHCLCADIFSLNLCHRRQHRDHQLSGILGAVNAILYADQVDTKILHELQRVQNIGCISAKSGELKDKHIDSHQ